MTSSKHSTPESAPAAAVVRALRERATPERARVNAWFFKTGPGQYGEGDTFLGVTVPEQRKIAKTFRELSLADVATLLQSPLHEVRLTALLILTYRIERAVPSTSSTRNGAERQLREVVQFYLAHLDQVNNWDLVDLSAPNILGRWCLETGNTKKLYTLVRSKKLWERRVAIVATYAFIRAGNLSHTFALAELLLTDTHDLMHKATGWMLREAGKRDTEALRTFLSLHAPTMPRTMLRYAIERLPEGERRGWRGERNTRLAA